MEEPKLIQVNFRKEVTDLAVVLSECVGEYLKKKNHFPQPLKISIAIDAMLDSYVYIAECIDIDMKEYANDYIKAMEAAGKEKVN